jgi:hypothetical protein
MSCPILMRLLLLFHLRPQLATPLQKAQCNWHLVGVVVGGLHTVKSYLSNSKRLEAHQYKKAGHRQHSQRHSSPTNRQSCRIR